ncbi:MAG TPA: alpha/beta hydrolase [Hyphomicrobiales bacterium]|nr:alpha/beta hydrolase [Hyphomicrobiales bacterium]
MKAADADILIVPGLANSGPDHWQSRWEDHLSTARRVVQDDWHVPARAAWVARILEAIAAAERPVVLVAHSLGVIAVAHAAASLSQEKVRGAFLVAPADVADELRTPDLVRSFAPVPLAPLPFPSVLVASRNDPYCEFGRAEDFGYAWGSLFIDAGESGHINAESGFGPWPEGSLVFARMLARLSV